jgi:hypothetical protein
LLALNKPTMAYAKSQTLLRYLDLSATKQYLELALRSLWKVGAHF